MHNNVGVAIIAHYSVCVALLGGILSGNEYILDVLSEGPACTYIIQDINVTFPTFSFPNKQRILTNSLRVIEHDAWHRSVLCCTTDRLNLPLPSKHLEFGLREMCRGDERSKSCLDVFTSRCQSVICPRRNEKGFLFLPFRPHNKYTACTRSRINLHSGKCYANLTEDKLRNFC